MSIFSICIVMNHGIVLNTTPISEDGQYMFPCRDDITLIKSILYLKTPEEIKYKVNEFTKCISKYSFKHKSYNKTDLYYNNKKYGLYDLMDFTNDILSKHKCQNIYLINMSYENIYTKTFEYIKGYRSKKPRANVYHSLAPGNTVCIENGAIREIENYSLLKDVFNKFKDIDFLKDYKIFLSKKIELKNIPDEWNKGLHSGRIVNEYSRDPEGRFIR